MVQRAECPAPREASGFPFEGKFISKLGSTLGETPGLLFVPRFAESRQSPPSLSLA